MLMHARLSSKFLELGLTRNTPHQDRNPSMGHLPVKNEAPHLKNTHPLKREAPFHEMIPKKSTINNNLKSA